MRYFVFTRDKMYDIEKENNTQLFSNNKAAYFLFLLSLKDDYLLNSHWLDIKKNGNRLSYH